jgi:hypothetical protein
MSQSLDTLLQRFSPIFREGQVLTSDTSTCPKELCRLREYAISVDEEFARWPASQPDEWKPNTIGSVDQRYIKGLLQGLTSFPSRVDVYYDRKEAFEFQLAIFSGTN